jgi:hypothetical protein
MTAIIVHVIVQIIGGGLAGYFVGPRVTDYAPPKNAVYGAIGGVLLAQISHFPITGLAAGPDVASILGNLIFAAIGGAISTTIAGFFKEPFKY